MLNNTGSTEQIRYEFQQYFLYNKINKKAVRASDQASLILPKLSKLHAWATDRTYFYPLEQRSRITGKGSVTQTTER